MQEREKYKTIEMVIDTFENWHLLKSHLESERIDGTFENKNMGKQDIKSVKILSDCT